MSVRPDGWQWLRPRTRPVKLPISVVIPTLNAAKTVSATLSSVSEGNLLEIIIVDGGSTDRTVEAAHEFGAMVISTLAGRGQQLAEGAEAAIGDWLLFLHADTVLDPGWPADVKKFIKDKDGWTHAAYFRFALDHDSPQAKRLESLVSWRCRYFGMPYGDQGLLISRELYQSVGGFSTLPLMEDIDILRSIKRKIGSKGLHCLPVRAVTASDRYRREGYIRRSILNLLCLAAYWVGIPTRHIARLYG